MWRVSTSTAILVTELIADSSRSLLTAVLGFELSEVAASAWVSAEMATLSVFKKA